MSRPHIDIKPKGPKSQEIKEAVDAAASRRGWDTGPWLLYLAAMTDPGVAKAMGIDTGVVGKDS